MDLHDLDRSVHAPAPEDIRQRLEAHLRAWLGAWPPEGALQVVGSVQRELPGWDGSFRPVLGVASPSGAVLSVQPAAAAPVAALGTTLEEVEPGLGTALGVPHGRLFRGVFRWSESPASLPDAGIWLPFDDPRVPEWLVPFGGEVLVALENEQQYMAGVGIKRHDCYGRELAVGTDPAYQGRGLARRLVAQAARQVLAEGAVPTYLHAPDNIASARAADAAGFPDVGWQILGFHAG